MTKPAPSESPWPARLRRAFALDLRSLAAFRVLLAVMLLYDLATRALDLSAHYSDEGVVPLALVKDPEFGSAYTSLHLLSGHVAWQTALFVLAAVFALMLLVGFKTRLATIASWYLLGSLHTRNPLICYEADSILVLLLFWSAFLPLGAVASLDRRGEPPPENPRWTAGGAAGLLLQVCFVYWFAALCKTGDPWFDGTAVAYALNVDQYSTWFGRALLDWPALTAALTWGTLLIEGGAPFLFLAPSGRARAVGIALVASMQVGFFLTMDLGIFPFVSLLALVPLIPTWAWERAARVRGKEAAAPEEVVEEPRGWANNLALGLILLVFAWNVTMLGDRGLNTALPAPVREAFGVLHLDQSWAMFAPEPMTDDGWFVVSAWQDDDVIDLFRGGAPVSWRKPADVADTFPRDRWKEFLMTAYERPHQGYWERYAQHVAREYREEHPGASPLVSLSVVYVLEETLPDLTPAPPQRIYVWNGRL